MVVYFGRELVNIKMNFCCMENNFLVREYFCAFTYYIFIYFSVFTGRQQVMIGVVPINVHHASSESCKSVYPIAIANCQENR